MDAATHAIMSSHQIMRKRSASDEALLGNLKVQFGDVQDIKCVITRWIRPAMGRVKLNSDGRSKGNPGRSGGGSLLRTDSVHFYGHTTNMVAETRALLQGVETCVDEGFLNMDVQVDSLILAKIVQISRTYRENIMAAR